MYFLFLGFHRSFTLEYKFTCIISFKQKISTRVDQKKIECSSKKKCQSNVLSILTGKKYLPESISQPLVVTCLQICSE